MKKTIEANLVSLSVAVGGLLVVMVVAIFAVQHGLGGSLSRIEGSTMPSQQAMTDLEGSVARLFEREVQMLATRSKSELDLYANRQKIEDELSRARKVLISALPEILGERLAHEHAHRLDQAWSELLASDRMLFESIERRHVAQQALDGKSAELGAALSKLIQETRGVAGKAHLDYVLTLRLVDAAASASEVRRLVHGAPRSQQEAAQSAVESVLQLGQLLGKIALAQNQDDLNSISANELSQNLGRGRAHLRTLLANFEEKDETFERASAMQRTFETLATSISSESDPQSLLRMRRAVVAEAIKSAELRKHVLETVKTFTHELGELQRIVSEETARVARSASRTVWLARLGTLAMIAVAAWIGVRSGRQIRESLGALRRQNERLESMGEELRTMNEGLEGLVQKRSEELARRERSMRLILDSMEEGLVAVDLSGKITGECSKAATEWFGAPEAGISAADYILPAGKERVAFEMGFAQIAEDLLPFEASADCMPKQFERDGRVFHVGYRQVIEDDRFQSVLMAVTDVTAQIAAEHREREAREQHSLFANLLRDRQGFQTFVADCDKLLAELRGNPDRARGLAALHTLKGTCAVFGMESMARRCHEVEEAVLERLGGTTDVEASELHGLFRSRLERLEEALTAESGIQLQEAEYGELLSGLHKRRDYTELVELVESWKWLNTSVLLGRLATQVRRVAERCGKDVDVTVEHNRLRLMPGPLDDFLSTVIHVVRNAVDHGIEPTEDRLHAGKPAAGRITLRTVVRSDTTLCLEISDDGRGLNLTALEAAARANGLVVNTRADVIAAMFKSGVTSKAEATELSGRGVGLDAVFTACKTAGGDVQVDTQEGRGTSFRFVFPRQTVQVRTEGATPSYTRSIRPAAARESA